MIWLYRAGLQFSHKTAKDSKLTEYLLCLLSFRKDSWICSMKNSSLCWEVAGTNWTSDSRSCMDFFRLVEKLVFTSKFLAKLMMFESSENEVNFCLAMWETDDASNLVPRQKISNWRFSKTVILKRTSRLPFVDRFNWEKTRQFWICNNLVPLGRGYRLQKLERISSRDLIFSSSKYFSIFSSCFFCWAVCLFSDEAVFECSLGCSFER